MGISVISQPFNILFSLFFINIFPRLQIEGYPALA